MARTKMWRISHRVFEVICWTLTFYCSHLLSCMCPDCAFYWCASCIAHMFWRYCDAALLCGPFLFGPCALCGEWMVLYVCLVESESRRLKLLCEKRTTLQRAKPHILTISPSGLLTLPPMPGPDPGDAANTPCGALGQKITQAVTVKIIRLTRCEKR